MTKSLPAAEEVFDFAKDKKKFMRILFPFY